MWLATVATVEVVESASNASSRQLDYTIILVALIAAVGSVLSVMAGRAAKIEATATRLSNVNDHGDVTRKLDEHNGILLDLIDVVSELRTGQGQVVETMIDVRADVGTLRDQFIEHLQHPHPVGGPA